MAGHLGRCAVPAQAASLRGARRIRAATANLVSNQGMDTMEEIEKRLMDLEVKASFGEDALDSLNQVIVRQQAQIDWLMRQLADMRQLLPEEGSSAVGRSRDELPPHY